MNYAVTGILLVSLVLTACTPQASPILPPMAQAAAPNLTHTPTPRAFPALEPDATPTPACVEVHGRTELLDVEADGLSAPILTQVHLPPCFIPHGKERYPVLILLHGQGFKGDQWGRLGAPQALDRLVSSGEIPPMLLVMPEEADTNANPFESPYGQALVSAVLNAVDQTYPTCARRECRAIGGLSRGASWAIYLALSHPDLFTAAGAHSLPPFHGLDRRLPELLAAIPAGQMPALYIDIGTRDPYRAPAAEFETLLNLSRVPHEWYLNQGQHDEEYWAAHVEEYLRWYAQKLGSARG